METENEYKWIKVKGKEQWDLYGSAFNLLQGMCIMRLGSITYSNDSDEYRFTRAWNVINPNGFKESFMRTVADKLKEINGGA